MRYEARSSAPPEVVWELMACPDRWHEWAPHVRGGEGLGSPRVVAGSSGTVSVLGAPVPASITAVIPGRMWAWKLGAVRIQHLVVASGEGSIIRFDLRGPFAAELAMRVSYGPLTALLARNLGRVAAGERISEN